MKHYLALHGIILAYALWAFFAKSAACEGTLGFMFFILYGLALFMLFLYAIGWQKILGVLPLGKAYANKAATVIWYIVLGVFCFDEIITWQTMLGATLVITGILTLSCEHD